MRQPAMLELFLNLLATLRSALRTRTELALENLALRQQLAALHLCTPRLRLRRADRAFRIGLSQIWTAQQIIEAFPEDTAPKYMIRDRDGIYGEEFRRRVQGMGIEGVLTAPQSPWQNPYAERMVGSLPWSRLPPQVHQSAPDVGVHTPDEDLAKDSQAFFDEHPELRPKP